jgi:hypothetical protein
MAIVFVDPGAHGTMPITQAAWTAINQLARQQWH